MHFQNVVLARVRATFFCGLLITIIFLTPVLSSRGMKKLRYAIQKSTKIKLE